MNKLNWFWVILIGSVYSLLFYISIMYDNYLPMEHLSLANPDPMYFLMLGVGLAFSGWFMFIQVNQNSSTEIATEVGGFAVSSLEPVATIDPLRHYRFNEDERIDEEIKTDLRKRINDSYRYEKYMSDDEIKDICDSQSPKWLLDGPEINEYLNEYMAGIDSIKPVGLYPDGGIKLIGLHGLRKLISGTSVLAVPSEYIIKHGDGGICVSAVKNYFDIEQVKALPQWLQRGVLEALPTFKAGKHIITFGNRPHWKCVRAFVERHENSKDDELREKPIWLWTLGLTVKPIDQKSRKKYLDRVGKESKSELDTVRIAYDLWLEREQKSEETVEKPQQEDNQNVSNE